MNAPRVHQPASFSSGPVPQIEWQARLRDSAPVITIIAIVTVYFAASSAYSIAGRLWDLVVFLIPAKLLLFLDEWLDPALFPKPLSPFEPLPTHEEKREILERLLGWDQPSSLLPSLGFLAKNTMLSSSRNVSRAGYPPGLVNRDNSCFQNSVLQALASLDNLRTYLTSIVAETDAGTLPHLDIAEALLNLVNELHNAESNGETFMTPRALKNMNTFWQQDAQEYFTRIVDEVHEEIQKAFKAVQKSPGLETDVFKDEGSASQHSDDSGYQTQSAASKQSTNSSWALRIPLEGLFAQRVVCTKCEYTSGYSLSSFQSITLNLQENLGEFQLEDLLTSYTEMERLEGVECHRCTLLHAKDKLHNILARVTEDPNGVGTAKMVSSRIEAIETALDEDDFEDKTLTEKCKIPPSQRVSTTKVKQVGIARPPQSIAFHINRSRFDGYTGNTYKILGPVQFPMSLDLGPWCLGSAGCRMVLVGGEETQGSDIEQWQLPPELSMVAGGERRSKLSGPTYQLRAVITHQGRHENGHYVCYRRHPRAPAEKAEEDKAQEDEKEKEEGTQDEEMSDDTPEEKEKDIEKDESPAQWWRISDETVREVDEETVLSQGGVFMLFYDRVDPNSVFVPTPAFDDKLLAAVGLSTSSAKYDEKFEAARAETSPDPQVAGLTLQLGVDGMLVPDSEKVALPTSQTEPSPEEATGEAVEDTLPDAEPSTNPSEPRSDDTESYSTRPSTSAESVASEDTAVDSVITETTVADSEAEDNDALGFLEYKTGKGS